MVCLLAPGTVLYTTRDFEIWLALIHSYTRSLVHTYTRSLVHSFTRTLVHSHTRSLVFDLYLFRPKTSVPLGHAQLRANVRADLADLADASQTRSQPQADIHLVRILSFPCVILASLI